MNHKKSIFRIDQGKLLGHIVSKEGINIELEKISDNKGISPPNNKKALISFFGNISFIRRFSPNFTEFVKPMTYFLKKLFHTFGMRRKTNHLKRSKKR